MARRAKTVSACFAAGFGGFAHVDLDTPLFFSQDPFEGGFEIHGPDISAPTSAARSPSKANLT
jgi:hypothetical protein